MRTRILAFLYVSFFIQMDLRAAVSCQKVFFNLIPDVSTSEQIVLNLYIEGSGLKGRRVNIDFKNSTPPLRSVLITEVKNEVFDNGRGNHFQQTTIYYKKGKQTIEITPDHVAQIRSIGVIVNPSKKASTYEVDTASWADYKLESSFAVPTKPNGQMIYYDEVMGKRVSFLIFKKLDLTNKDKKSDVITGELIGWPRYHQNYTYTVRTDSGKVVEVEAHSIRRFRVLE